MDLLVFGWLIKVKKAITNVTTPLARDCLPELVRNLTSNVTNKFERTVSRKRAVKEGERFTLFILNEGMNEIIKIIKSLQDSGVLIDGVTETVKRELCYPFELLH